MLWDRLVFPVRAICREACSTDQRELKTVSEDGDGRPLLHFGDREGGTDQEGAGLGGGRGAAAGDRDLQGL